MSKITITEALAEIPTLLKRIDKKREFVKNYLFRQSAVRDPHEKDGGSQALIASELQGVADLQDRLVAIRAAIQKANAENFITIDGTESSIADWLTWRRELAPREQAFLDGLSKMLSDLRKKAAQQGVGVSEQDKGVTADWIVNINEKELSEKIENYERTLGALDGQLSLKNATITV